MSQRLAIKYQALTLTNWVIHIEVLLSDQVLVEVQTLEICHKSSERFQSQRLVHHFGNGSWNVFLAREKSFQLLQCSVCIEKFGARLERRPDGGQGENIAQQSDCRNREIALED